MLGGSSPASRLRFPAVGAGGIEVSATDAEFWECVKMGSDIFETETAPFDASRLRVFVSVNRLFFMMAKLESIFVVKFVILSSVDVRTFV